MEFIKQATFAYKRGIKTNFLYEIGNELLNWSITKLKESEYAFSLNVKKDSVSNLHKKN